MNKKQTLWLWLQKLSLIGFASLVTLSIAVPLYFGKEKNSILIDLSLNIGIALFTTLSISKYLQKETKELILDEIPLLQEANEIGIKAFPVSNDITILDDFSSSKELFIIMNDGKNFISNNASKLKDRFRNGGTTTFIFLNGDSEAEKLLCTANGKSKADVYKDKIAQSIQDIENYKKDYSNHIFEVFYTTNLFFVLRLY